MHNSRAVWLNKEDYAAILEGINSCRQGVGRAQFPWSRLARLKEPVLHAAVKCGYEVVNADRIPVKGYGSRGNMQIVYYSSNSDNAVVRRHLGAGGSAVFLRDGRVLGAFGSMVRTICDTATNPRALDTAQLDAALASVAGLLVLGILQEE
ncbi:MAG: hypothetical protein ACOX0T_09435 [Pelotomaculum sp.]|jgi:cyanophycin synthetase